MNLFNRWCAVLGLVMTGLCVLPQAGAQEAIKEAGFEPQLRNQQYEFRTLPEGIEEQIVNY